MEKRGERVSKEIKVFNFSAREWLYSFTSPSDETLDSLIMGIASLPGVEIQVEAQGIEGISLELPTRSVRVAVDSQDDWFTVEPTIIDLIVMAQSEL